ncbi:PP2C family serine/threonine-protein phosphatase [Thalassobacillus pellis]|uniref:PP2C family serine/threonine-protein phosphatase n=1 Tax=Thalassobacillus pellis TaxID=748008 RepID=UPI001EF88D0D|nr:PP2C family serine/threonine-protein phosphatase [Thalassobacillus pellis]MBM7554401.1 negative regulator of sigma-B (phosphoserine phosphatase) [Thalassobacillus pellis]
MSESNDRLQISVYQKPKKGNYYCGDSYYYKETDKSFVCALADGLGSGELAKISSQAVMDIIEEFPDLDIESLIKKCNEALLSKRGVVLGILKIDFSSNTYSYSSIGNIGIMTVTSEGKKKRNIPLAGYLSGYPRKLRVVHGKLEPGLVFIMFSDGVNERQLSLKLFHDFDVRRIIEQYDIENGGARDDDTTLIAMKYD